MAYIDGFVVPVLPGKKEAYRKMASDAGALFKEFGALALVECFEDDIKDGKVTDFRRAVKAEPGEQIVFSWIVWPDKETRDAGNRKLMDDPRMQPDGEVPFSMERLIMGGFTPIFQFGDALPETSTSKTRETEPV